MNDADKPDLSLTHLTVIADELYELDKALWEELRPMLMPKSINERTVFLGPRPPKLSAKFYLILSNFSRHAFLQEASSYPRYPPNPNFSNWILNLAQRTEDHVVVVVQDIERSDPERNFAYHGVVEEGMRGAIKQAIQSEMGRYHELKLPEMSRRPPLPPHVQKQMALGGPQAEESQRVQVDKRTKGTIHSPGAVAKLDQYLQKTGMGYTEFATKAGTTDKTLRGFRSTGRVRRYVFDGIAKAMGMTREQLLND